LTGTLTGLVQRRRYHGELLTVANTNSLVGNYAIVPTLIDPGSKLVNYTVTTNNGTLSRDSGQLTGTADNKSRLYGPTQPRSSP